MAVKFANVISCRFGAAGAHDPREQTLSRLLRLLAETDPPAHRHAYRVRELALALADELRVPDTLIDVINTAARLHDIGKLTLPDEVLHTPGQLTPQQFAVVKQHAALGADLLNAVGLPDVARMVRHHHENWDGSGYPDGLRGEAIPLGARILAIVDCYDALTSHRTYRPALSPQDAIAVIIERQGTYYEPAITQAFVDFIRRTWVPQTWTAWHLEARLG